MAKVKKEKVVFFEEDLASHCGCGMRGDDRPWRDPPSHVHARLYTPSQHKD
jgi:hypothetical protein